MAAKKDRPSRLSMDIERELRRRIEAAAAERHLSVRDYVVTTLRHAVGDRRTTDPPTGDVGWSRLSAPAFARDWESDADAVYDDLA